MNYAEREWEELKAHLSPDEQTDGRRCFLAGLLAGMAMTGREKLEAVPYIEDALQACAHEWEIYRRSPMDPASDDAVACRRCGEEKTPQEGTSK